MKIKLLFSLFLMLLVAVFCVQNAGVITVSFLHWHFAVSQALVILLAAFFGVLAGLLAGMLGRRRRPELPPRAPAP